MRKIMFLLVLVVFVFAIIPESESRHLTASLSSAFSSSLSPYCKEYKSGNVKYRVGSKSYYKKDYCGRNSFIDYSCQGKRKKTTVRRCNFGCDSDGCKPAPRVEVTQKQAEAAFQQQGFTGLVKTVTQGQTDTNCWGRNCNAGDGWKPDWRNIGQCQEQKWERYSDFFCDTRSSTQRCNLRITQNRKTEEVRTIAPPRCTLPRRAPTPAPAVTPSAPKLAADPGFPQVRDNLFTANYYDGVNFDNFRLGVRASDLASSGQGDERKFSKDWGIGAPDQSTNVGADQFSVKYVGRFDLTAGQYEFWTNSDDGSRLYLIDPNGNRRLIVDNWGLHGVRRISTNSADTSLQAGRHTIQVEYFEQGGGASIEFGWKLVSASVQKLEAFGFVKVPDDRQMNIDEVTGGERATVSCGGGVIGQYKAIYYCENKASSSCRGGFEFGPAGKPTIASAGRDPPKLSIVFNDANCGNPCPAQDKRGFLVATCQSSLREKTCTTNNECSFFSSSALPGQRNENLYCSFASGQGACCLVDQEVWNGRRCVEGKEKITKCDCPIEQKQGGKFFYGGREYDIGKIKRNPFKVGGKTLDCWAAQQICLKTTALGKSDQVILVKPETYGT